MTMENQPAPVQFLAMINGYKVTQALYTAAQLGIADLLKNNSLSAEELAKSTSTKAHFLYRLLRMLASINVLKEEPGQRFALTDLGQLLRSDRPDSMRAFALMTGTEHYRAFAELGHSVRTGEIAFQKVFGMECFDYLTTHPESAAIFDQAMTGFSAMVNDPIAATIDLSGVTKLIDVGGGAGTLISAILKRHHRISAAIYDLPHVIARTRALYQSQPDAPRCELAEGSFFERIPPGYEGYLMKNILHDWSDERAQTILENIRKVIPSTGRLFLAEMVVTDDPQNAFPKLLDLTMMTMCGGRERTEDEWRSLLSSSGFGLRRILKTGTPICIIEGIPA